MCVGATTHQSARFNVKTTGAGAVGVEVADNDSMTGAVLSPTVARNGYGAGTVEVVGLTPGTRYWWRGRDSGTTDTARTGTFLTDPVAPGEPASHTIGLWGDAGLTPAYPGIGTQVPHRSSFHPVAQTMLQRAVAEDWARIVSLGDDIYYNLGSGSFGLSADATAAQYRSQFDDELLHEARHQLVYSCPWVRLRDDHDTADNDCHSGSPGVNNANAVYRERIPSYDLPAAGDTGGIWHSFDIARVRYIASDTRSDRVPGSTMLGAEQLAWLEAELVAAHDTAEALVWLMPTPWLGTHHDTWGGYIAERSTLADLIGDTGWRGRLQMMTADVHAAAIDTGASNPWGRFPITLCASVDATPSGPTSRQYDVAWRPGRGQYATLRVDDHGGDLALTTTIWRGTRALAWHTHTITV